MSPEEAARGMRKNAKDMLILLEKIQQAKLHNLSKKDLYVWCCQLLEQNADIHLSMASMMEQFGQIVPIEIDGITVDRSIVSYYDEDPHYDPPFDPEYFWNLNDL